MDKLQDFSQRRHFPGTSGNRFDQLLHQFVEIENIPWQVFTAMLFGWSVLINAGNMRESLLLWSFFLADWLLLERLPATGTSYGLAKPVVVMLAAARSLALVLPFALWLPLQALGTLLVVYGFWFEPHHIRVTRQKIVTDKLPAGTKLTLLHLADLHVERITARERVLNFWIKKLQPDVLVFSGDFINLSYIREARAREEVRSLIRDWKAPLGAFAVTGSPAVDLEEVFPHIVEGMPLHWLREECVRVPVGESTINIVGMGCTHKPHVDAPVLKQILPHKPANFTVLLYHTPDLAPEAAQTGVDLQLSGHTHGGQVRLPLFGALFAGSLYGKRFEAGRYQVGEMTLYTSRGIGMEGAAAPRVRFLCPPEIIFWEICGK